MLQSLAGKLNRLNDVRQIGDTIATELRLLIDYHNCRVVLRRGDDLLPIAFVGEYDERRRAGRGPPRDEGRTGRDGPRCRAQRGAARAERARV